MINLYAYAYPGTMNKFPGFILTKIGDSHRDAKKRMGEQGGAAENEEKIEVGIWPNCKVINRDHDLHKVLIKQGLHHSGNHKGTEWFKIPGKSVKEAFKYIDQEIAKFEGKKVRKKVILRQLQKKTLDQAMKIIEVCARAGKSSASLIANLCPRFGKTVWALSLFNRITEKYGNNVMLIPAYWLSAHSSFISELDEYDDFRDIIQIDVDDPNAEREAAVALGAGKRIIVAISLHGDLDPWKKKHRWISKIPNQQIFMFADEGDFGTHTDNQVSKLDFLFNR
jgi:hypothetical protein